MDPLSRLMMFLRALRHPTTQAPVNQDLTELAERQDAVQVRLDRLAESYRRQGAALRRR